MPIFPTVLRRPVLLRLAVVALAALTATALATWRGPPMPYRIGETYPFDLRVRADFEILNQVELINRHDPLRPGGESADARGGPPGAGERPILERYPRGKLIAPRDQPLNGRAVFLLREDQAAVARSLTRVERLGRAGALFLVYGLLATVMVLYVVRFQTALACSLRDIAKVAALATLTFALAVALSGPPWHASLVPLTVTAMVLTLAYNPQFALMLTLSLTLGLGVALGTDLRCLLQEMGGLATAVLLLRNVRTRTRLVQVGVGAGAAYLIMTVATSLLWGQTWQLMISDAARNFTWGALAGFLLTGLLPLVERVFNVVTDISLLELADGAHPLLQELVRRAPGTYTHSITVATLAEAAADAIGANTLLVRVGSYFHDVGKMLKPHYFIENQDGLNRHDALEPALSTLIIIGHVKDGVALARQYQLPAPIVDFIAQHHGTTLVEYFYREAMRLQEACGNGSTALEPCFRYPGPKPQTRENGILMLADCVESASRALTDPAPGSLRKLVHDLLMKRLLDGQFEESGLTLTELHRIEEALGKSLIALFHARIKYPEPPQVQEKAG